MERLDVQKILDRLGLESGGKLSVELNTTLGAISCELWPEEAPRTVLNFVELAEGTRQWKHPKTRQTVKEPLYDGTIFHRVIPKFMIQGGDPLGTGTGGPGYTFEDEVDQGLSFDRPGLLAMANSGPDTNGSQFFITDRSTPTHLTGKHTIFGICENLDIVEAIATAETARRDRPAEDVVLERVRIVRE
ncbi:MAG: peptidylprolyl isomerase [Myxococcota bacterium]|nr:peptidylprolyl isomerase [Myxococcota bacterium]